MTKIIEEVVTPAKAERREKKTVAVACDFCGSRSKDDDPVEFCNDGLYSRESVAIKHVTGSSYPDNGEEQTECAHVCPGCWESRVKPWLESQGVVLTKHDRDW